MKLTKQKIDSLYYRFIKGAKRCIERHHYNDAIQYIKAAAKTKYEFYLGYTDETIEEYLRLLSRQIKRVAQYRVMEKKRCVFYSISIADNKGLTQQYVDALIANNYEFLFIHIQDLKDNNCRQLYKTLSTYKGATAIQVPKELSFISKSQWLYDKICEYGSDKVLMQLFPHSVFECIAFYALPPEIKRYNLNLTDHTYWIGKGCMDYTFEFRQYGCFLSTTQRGFNQNQALLLPFYPVMKHAPFEGFPFDVDNKIIFFSGGAFYKVFDEEQTFFKLCRKILDATQESVIIFAGSGDLSAMQKAISNNGMDGRFLLIGERHDIFEVFKHVDIYINTYPLGGGLMSLYAAHCGVPILNYLKSGIEGCVGQKHDIHFTSSSENDFINEAKRLCSDINYRQEKGQALRNAVISIDEFNRGFEIALEKKLSPTEINISGIVETKLDQEGKMQYENKSHLYSLITSSFFGLKGLVICPDLFFDCIPLLFTNKMNALCKKIFH